MCWWPAELECNLHFITEQVPLWADSTEALCVLSFVQRVGGSRCFILIKYERRERGGGEGAGISSHSSTTPQSFCLTLTVTSWMQESSNCDIRFSFYRREAGAAVTLQWFVYVQRLIQQHSEFFWWTSVLSVSQTFLIFKFFKLCSDSPVSLTLLFTIREISCFWRLCHWDPQIHDPGTITEGDKDPLDVSVIICSVTD